MSEPEIGDAGTAVGPPVDRDAVMRQQTEALKGWAEGVTEETIRGALMQAIGTEQALNRALVAPNMRFDQQRQVLINQAVMLKALAAILDRIHYGQTGKSCFRPVGVAPGAGNGQDKSGKVK